MFILTDFAPKHSKTGGQADLGRWRGGPGPPGPPARGHRQHYAYHFSFPGISASCGEASANGNAAGRHHGELARCQAHNPDFSSPFCQRHSLDRIWPEQIQFPL